MPGIKNNLLAITFIMMAGLHPIGSSAAENLDLAGLMKQRGEALVTVKYVLHVNMGNSRGSQESEAEGELTCPMIRADGLVACSNNRLSGFVNMLANMSPRLRNSMSATPKDLEVLVDSHEQAFKAEIIAVDTELDITWIQITETRDTSFSYIDFDSGGAVDIGDAVITVRRTGSLYGRTLAANRNHIGGITDKPRRLYIPAYTFTNSAGLPVFDSSGEVIGLIVTQFPETINTTGGTASILGGGMANLQEAQSGVILPANEIAKATQRAMEVESY